MKQIGSQAEDREAMAQWIASPKQVRELMDDSYKPSTGIGLLKVSIYMMLSAISFIAAFTITIILTKGI